MLATPADWNPDPQVVALVLAGLRDHPFIRATTLDGYFATTPADTNDDGAPIVTTLVPIRPKRPTVTEGQLAAANESLTSFRSLVGNRDRRVTEGAHAILIAPSSALDPRTATHELASIDQAAGAFLSSISTTGRTITLTSRTARIPLSFRKRHRADGARQGAPGEHQADVPGRIRTHPRASAAQHHIAVPGRRAHSGTFTMRVTLTTADDQFTIDATEMTVRSTVFSSIGVLLTVGALLFLAFWWGNHIWRSRRMRRQRRHGRPHEETA